jgi:hypothetical protein
VTVIVTPSAASRVEAVGQGVGKVVVAGRRGTPLEDIIVGGR